MRGTNKRYRVKMSPFEVFNLVVTLILSLLFLISIFWVYSNIYINNGDASKTYYNNKKPTVVISESMEPTIKTNGVIVVEKTPFNEVYVGDIIVVETKDHGKVVHRVVEDNYGEVTKEQDGIEYKDTVRYLVTKGDNNKTRDWWVVVDENYEGKVVKIHNEVSGIIDFYFRDITKATPFQILWGILLITITLSFIIVVIIWVYDFIMVPIFLRLSLKTRHPEEVKEVYYPWLKDRVIEKDAVKTISELTKDRGVLERIKFNILLMMWHNAMASEAKKAMKSKRRYENLKGLFKDEGDK